MASRNFKSKKFGNCDRMRPLVKMNQLWTLATTWYSTRLQENARRPQPGEMRSIFAGLGLGGDFWDPQSDTFG
jgi:hypothetical protein